MGMRFIVYLRRAYLFQGHAEICAIQPLTKSATLQILSLISLHCLCHKSLHNMLELDKVSYLESAAVTAISDFYKFLTKMYLDKETVEYPPEGG
jgi:hypothetical protein